MARHDLNRTAIPGKLAGERSSATPKPPAEASDAKDGKDGKKKIRWSEAWQEASVLVWARRGRLALGLVRDADQPAERSRAAGLVEVPHRRRPHQGPDRAADADRARHRRRDAGAGGDVVRAVAAPRHRGAGGHHRDAARRPRAHHAPAGALLRQDAVGRPDLARDERRGRHPQPRRHRPGAAHREHRHRRPVARRPLLPELAPDADHAAHPRRLRRGDGLRLQEAAPAVPRARQDQRRGHRPADPGARRHPRRQGLHGREARADRVRAGRPQAAAQRHRSR